MEYLQKGGIISVVLLATLFITLSLALERAIYFWLTHGKKSAHSQSSRIAKLARDTAHLPLSVREDLLEKEGSRIRQEMISKLWLLDFISSSAPSAGLLGTIVGLIQTFQDMAAEPGNLDIQNLSGGIWEAMLTTMMGLVVAIPAHFFYSYFQNLTNKRLFLMGLEIPSELTHTAAAEPEVKELKSHSAEVANYG
ncbi:MAG: MotA/TolQ/ExbB proton channel family protein [Spirochaetota bacterium]